MSISNKKIEKNQIHIWKIDLNNPGLNVDHLYSDILSFDERKRADRLRSDKDRKRFVASRGLLRENLGNYLDVDPAGIVFTYNKHGKPSIKSEDNTKDIKFNVSHSKDLAIYAIGCKREIGVDLEYIRDIDRADKIISRFFTDEEKNFYYSQPEDKKKLTFFTLWTRKEAYSKARGMGIGLPLKEFDLGLIPNRENGSSDKIKSKWSFIDIEVDKDYLAALATEGNNVDLNTYEFKA